MRKIIATIVVLFTLLAALTGCGQKPLSDGERQKRTEDYARLVESLK